MSTILVDGNYAVGAGQILTFAATSGTPVYTLDGNAVFQSNFNPPVLPDPNFTDYGSINVTSADANASIKAFGDDGGTFFFNSLIKIAQSASLTVSATGAGSTAYGYGSGSWPAAVENDGTFNVSAIQTAVGASLYEADPYSSAPRFLNTGIFSVSAANATGVQSGYPGICLNSGTLTVTGTTSAVGIAMGYFEGGSVTNSGTITVTASSGTAYGITVGGLDEVLTINNSGTITAQHAIYESNSSSPAQTPILQLTNSGTINGDIVLGEGPGIWSGGPGQSAGAQIHNTGAINGAIHLDTNGNDLFDGRGGTQTGGVYLGGGTDTVYLGNDGESVYGGSGAANVTGGTGADTFVGGASNDFVAGGGGNDVLDGGGGINIVSFATATTGVSVSLASPGSAQATGVGSVTLSNFQNLIGSTHADHLTGDANNNVIDGDGGDDAIDGGGGTNTISFASATSGVTVSLALQGSAQATGLGSVTLSNFQNLTGSAYADHLTGDASNNVLDGGGGNDVIDGGGGTNTISFASTTAGVTVSLASQGSAQTTGAGSVTLSNFQNMIGSANADHLTGDANNNVIDGGGGGDVLDGGGGTNTISFASATTGVTVSLASQGAAQTSGVGSVTLSNFQNLIGSAFNDTLQASSGNNVLTGGAGADSFVETPNGGADTIADLSDAQGDKVDLSQFYKFTTLAQVLALATQSNADTVIDFGSGNTLTLQNVILANLTASDFVLTTGPINVGATTVTTDPTLNLSVTTGSLVYFAAYSGGTLINNGTLALTSTSSATGVISSGAAAIFENDGGFSVSGAGAAGVSYATTHNAGTFTVTNTTGAGGTEGATGNVVNSGSMTVQGAGQVYGVDDSISGGLFQNLATGVLSVSSSTDLATGVVLFYGGDFENAGQITVSAATAGSGLNFLTPGGGTINNSGTLSVSGTGSTGIYVSGYFGGSPLILTNSGTITAHTAITDSGVGANVTNSGTLNGGVVLSSYDDHLVNTGAINGAVSMGDGNDIYDGRGGTLTGILTLGAGASTVYLGADGETVHGGAGAAHVTGGTGADTFVGGAGNDFVAGGGGNDVLDGGGGINTVSFASATTGITVSLASLGSAQAVGADTVTLSNFQNLIGSTHADHLTGDANNNVIDGGGGGDVIDGGGGTNTISFASATSGVTVSLALQGSAQATGLGSVTLSNFQNLIGSAYADHLTGDANDNVIDGGDGNDVIDGGGGTNTISFASTTAGVTFSLALQGQAQSTGVGAVTATNFRNMVGSAYADYLTGDANNNVIDGGGGNDVLDGGGGTNTVSFASAATGVTVSLASQGWAQVTGVGSVTLSNFQNLIGSAFNDTLQGAPGNNILTGGAGADTFVETPNGGVDTITDFSDAQGDKIDLSQFYKFGSLAQVKAMATQSNADTVIDFGSGNTLTLQNVTLANLTASDFVFTTGPINVGATTVTTDSALNLSLTSGPLVVFTTYSGGTLINKGALALTSGSFATGVTTASEPAPSTIFENDGAFSVTALSPVGVNYATTHNIGTFTVTGTSAGYSTQGADGDVVNSGSMTIHGPGSTTGVDDWNPGGVFQNLAGGTYSISSSADSATGVILVYGAAFQNAGQMTVSAAASAVGLNYGAYIGGNTISNTGTITVSGASSTGITIGTYYGVPSVSLTNSGTITAQTAIAYTGSGAYGVDAVITNSGTLNGAVLLSPHDDTVVNTGTINGAVSLGDGADTLDSHLGTINGVVTLGSGSSTATLGAENNTVALAAGTHVVDGGGGTNTVSCAGAISAVQVSLALQGQAQNTGVGTDTLSNIQTVIGSAYGDTLDGGGSAATSLTGGLGADIFVYRSGDGAVTVQDFSHAQGDRIDLSSLAAFPVLSDVLTASSQVGSDTVITIGSGSLRLQGVSMSSLTAADFIFGSGPTVGPNIGGAPITGSGTLTGTTGSDWLQGGSGADTLHGGAGSDYLDGGPGLNTATYDGAYRQYTVGTDGATVSGGPEGGTDDLTHIQRIQFADGYLATSPTDTAGQVYRIYEATLGRAPDQEGLTNWVNGLNSGASLQSVVGGFVNSTEFQQVYGPLDDAHFVTLLYHNVLHRDPDQAGLNNWVGMLTSGQETRAQVVLGFSESPEDVNDLAAPVQQGLWIANPDAGEVARLYDTVLGRLPDGSGLANWTHSLESGASLQSVADGFVGSAEFQAVYGTLNNSDFVTLLYHNVLHRDPDQAGLTNWVSNLASGETRAQVVVGFSESAEHITNTATHVDSGIWLAG